MITLPTKPTFTEPTLQSLMSLQVMPDLALESVSFSGLVKPTYTNTSYPLTTAYNFVNNALLLQQILEDRLDELINFAYPSDASTKEWLYTKEEILRKWYKARRDLLNAEAAKNGYTMNGALKRKLLNMTLDERKELSEAGLKILKAEGDITREQIETGLRLALGGSAIAFDHHNKVQAANLEKMVAIADASLRDYEILVQLYNKDIELLDAEIQAYQTGLEVALQQAEKYMLIIQNAGLDAEDKKVLTAIYAAQVRYLVEEAKLDTTYYEGKLIQSEVERNKIKMYAAEIEKYLADINYNSALYENFMLETKAAATIAETNLTVQFETIRAKMEDAAADLKVQQAIFEGSKQKARTIFDVGADQIQIEKEGISTARDALESAVRDAQAVLSEYKAQLSDFEKMVNDWVAQARLTTIATEASERYSNRVGIATSTNASKIRVQTDENEMRIYTRQAETSARVETARAEGVARIEEKRKIVEAETTARLNETMARTDVRLNETLERIAARQQELTAKIDADVDQTEAKIAAKYNELNAKIVTDLNETQARIDAKVEEVDTRSGAASAEVQAKIQTELRIADAQVTAKLHENEAKIGTIEGETAAKVETAQAETQAHVDATNNETGGRIADANTITAAKIAAAQIEADARIAGDLIELDGRIQGRTYEFQGQIIRESAGHYARAGAITTIGSLEAQKIINRAYALAHANVKSKVIHTLGESE